MFTIEEIKKASRVINDNTLKEVVRETARRVCPGYHYRGFSLGEDKVYVDVEEYIGCGDYRQECFSFPIEMIYDTEQVLAHVKSLLEEEIRQEEERRKLEEQEQEENKRIKLISDFNAAKKALEDIGLSPLTDPYNPVL